MAEGFLFYSALSDLNFGYITEATAFAVAFILSLNSSIATVK